MFKHYKNQGAVFHEFPENVTLQRLQKCICSLFITIITINIFIKKKKTYGLGSQKYTYK